MRRMLLGLLAVGLSVAAAVAAGSAGAARQAAAARGHNTVEVKIPLPAPDHAQVSLVTLRATAPAGRHVGALSVRSPNGAQVGNENVNAVAVISPRSSRKRSATFKVYVFINRGSAVARDAFAGGGTRLDVVVSGSKENFLRVLKTDQLVDCPQLGAVGLLGDSTPDATPAQKLGTGGDTPPEQVEDQTAHDLCPANAEPVDPGNS